MKARAPTPLFEEARRPSPQKALTPTPLPGGEGRTGGAAHPFSLGEGVARRAG